MVGIFRPQKNPIQITVAEVATHDSISAAGTIVKVVRFPGSLLLCCALLLIGLPSRAAADTFTIALTSPVDRLGFATITATVMGPTTLNTTMLVDTGAAVGFAFDTNSLFSAFLVDGMVGRAQGVGGNTPITTGATVPMLSMGFTPAPTIPGGQVATQPNFPMTFDSLPLPPLPKQGIIGMNYLNTFASVAFNNMGTPASMVLDTTKNVSQARPNNADSEAAVHIPSGTFPNGSANLNTNVFSVRVPISSIGGTPIAANFVIDSGVEDSLITSSLAAALGLNPGSLPSSTYSTELGSFSAPYATALFSLFPNDPNFPQLSSANVAIGDSTNDPAGINLLGSDILSQLSYWEIDPGVSTFAAAPVPEPSALTLLGLALAGLAAARLLSGRSKPHIS